MRGRPFPTGKSGNPGGRPKVIGELRELARTHASEAVEELARLALKAKSETARIAAIRELLDRGYGRPMQTHEIADPNSECDSRKTAAELSAEIVAEMKVIGLWPENPPRGPVPSRAHS